MGNKRLTIQRVDQFIRLLGATEKVNGYAEQQKQHAIACLNNYQIINLDIVNQSLEEIFMHFYGGEVDHVQ